MHILWYKGTYHPSMFDEFYKYRYWYYLEDMEEEYQMEMQELDFEAFLNKRMDRKKRNRR